MASHVLDPYDTCLEWKPCFACGKPSTGMWMGETCLWVCAECAIECLVPTIIDAVFPTSKNPGADFGKMLKRASYCMGIMMENMAGALESVSE